MKNQWHIILTSFRIILWRFSSNSDTEMTQNVYVKKYSWIFWESTIEETHRIVFKQCLKWGEKEKWWYFYMYILIRAKSFAIIWRVENNIFIFKETHSNLSILFMKTKKIWMSFFENKKMLESTLQIMANNFALIKIYMQKISPLFCLTLIFL